jgi:asparagine synthase (glutamine-hydrolysing)
MCGFNVIISGNRGKKELISTMNHLLEHRGPDSEGYFEDNCIALGHRRLSIIDTTSNANQPMTCDTEDIVLVYNGEIYNYLKLKQSLNYSFKSSSDTEVIIALYKKHGPSFIAMLDGMFSFCLYDRKEKKVVIARDRMGQKPLYYYQGDDFLVLSSEIRPLLKSSYFNPEFDQYLNFKTVYAPKTIIKGILSFEAASYSVFSINDITEKGTSYSIENIPYWDYANYSVKHKDLSYEYSKKKLKELFITSVEKRLMADVGLGVYLSGGVDSTAITGVLSSLSDKKIDTFSIDFKEKDYSEQAFVEQASQFASTHHHTLGIDKSYFLDHFMEALDAMDHPGEDGLNNFFISQFARKNNVNVVLSGIGGDELFGGYFTFDVLNTLKNAAPYWSLPSFLKNVLILYRSKYKKGLITDILRQVGNEGKFDFDKIYPFLRSAYSELYNEQSIIDESYLFERKANFDQKHFMSNISQYEMNFYMQNVLLRDADNMSMANSIELRAPFLDADLIEFSLGLNDETKGNNKMILKDALNEFIPSEIQKRSKKGFVIPIKKWLVPDLRNWIDDKTRQLFERDLLVNTQFLSNENNNGTDYYQRMWHLAVLEHWIQKNMDSNE